MDTIGITILFAGVLFFIFLVSLKTLSFGKATHRPTIRKWLYFTKIEIESSSDDTSRHYKNRQNILSISILVLLSLCIIIYKGYDFVQTHQ
jgi:predicted transporter